MVRQELLFLKLFVLSEILLLSLGNLEGLSLMLFQSIEVVVVVVL